MIAQLAEIIVYGETPEKTKGFHDDLRRILLREMPDLARKHRVTIQYDPYGPVDTSNLPPDDGMIQA